MTWPMDRVAPRRGPVHYDSKNHFQVLCQCFGSLWPRVVLYCITNSLLMFAVSKLKQYQVIDLSISGQGHGYAGVIVSFLVVSRINTALARYNECRGNIGVMYRENRELLQTAYVLTRRDENLSRSDKEWRSELAYRAMIMLRTAISVIEYSEHKIPAWAVSELSGYELDYCTPTAEWRRYASSASNTELQDSNRAPLRMAYLVRETIGSQKGRLSRPLQPQHEIMLFHSVDSFMTGWFGMTKFLTTPVPFPLIQMTRTIVLFYVFTLPLIFLNDPTQLFEHCFVIFLLTYGFVGLELVSIELDNPFGNDENDFDCYAFARGVFDDTYLMIHDTDGPEYADIVRRRMNSGKRAGGAVSETTGLLLYNDEFTV